MAYRSHLQRESRPRRQELLKKVRSLFEASCDQQVEDQSATTVIDRIGCRNPRELVLLEAASGGGGAFGGGRRGLFLAGKLRRRRLQAAISPATSAFEPTRRRRSI